MATPVIQMILLMHYHKDTVKNNHSGRTGGNRNSPYQRQLEEEIRENNRKVAEEARKNAEKENPTLFFAKKSDPIYFATLLNACEKLNARPEVGQFWIKTDDLDQKLVLANDQRQSLYQLCLQEDSDQKITLSESARNNMKQYMKM